MKWWGWLFIAGAFAGVNALFLTAAQYNMFGHILTNMIMVFGGVLAWFLIGNMMAPKGLDESIRIARQFHAVGINERETANEQALTLIEAARYKEDMLKTRENVVHGIVFRDEETGDMAVLKDDPHIKKGIKSIVYAATKSSYQDRPYMTKAEIEREVRMPISVKQKKDNYNYKIVTEKKKEEVKAS